VSARVGIVLAALLAVSGLGCGRRTVSDEQAREEARREEFRLHVLATEDAGRTGDVSSRPDVVFEDGFTKIMFDPTDDFRGHAFRWLGPNAHVRLKSHGNKRMRLHFKGWLDLNKIQTWPVITVFINGVAVKKPLPPVEFSFFEFESEISPDAFEGHEWADLHIVVASVAWHWLDAKQLSVAIIDDFDWVEVP
jgi:hypothetical protein